MYGVSQQDIKKKLKKKKKKKTKLQITPFKSGQIQFSTLNFDRFNLFL